MRVEFFKHNVDKIDIQNVTRALNELFLTTGEWVKTFEDKLANYVRAKYAVGVTSCTDALELCLMAYNIDENAEVITTPMSFMATANAIEYTKATPVFVDIEKETGNLNANLLESVITKKTKAIIPVHLYGQLCDMKKIREIAHKHHLAIIEDAAHALEGKRDDYVVGELGDMACYSFYATKNITSGEGGAISLNLEDKTEWLKLGRLHGMAKGAAERYQIRKFQHQQMKFLGLKANMSNIQAALLLNQLDKVEERLALREKIALKYDQAFQNQPEIELVKTLPGARSARHLYVIKVPSKMRDKIIMKLQEHDIGCAANYPPIHLLEYYQKKYRYQKGAFPVAENFGNRVISLPIYPLLKENEQAYVIEILLKIIKSLKKGDYRQNK